MAAYIVFIREGAVFNAAEMEQYARQASAVPNEPGLKPLVIYGHLETLEGKPADGVVLLEFPSLKEAKAWYQSPEYQAAAEHRKKGANYRVLLLGGV